jgi:ATP-binding cassette subfamily B protein
MTRTDWRLIASACGTIRSLSPGLLEFGVMRAWIQAFIPYIAIYMSARIIDELAGDKDVERLLLYAGIAAGGTWVMSVVSEWLAGRANVLNAMFRVKVKHELNRVRFAMEFAKLEDPKCNELHANIIGSMFMVNGGLTALAELFTQVAGQAVSATVALIFIQGAVRPTALSMEDSPSMSGIGESFLYQPVLFMIVLLAVIIVCIALTVRNSIIESRKEFGLFHNAPINKYLEYYHYHYMEDDYAAKDIHIFDQRKLIMNEVIAKGRRPWMNIVNGKYSLMQRYFGANAAISAFVGGFAYIFVGLVALNGSISLGSVTQSYASIMLLVTSVSQLSVALSQMKSNNNYLRLFYEYADIPTEGRRGTEVPAKRNGGWELEFHDVSFRYPNGHDDAVRHLSLKLSPNSRTAIVGMNGSGKTTVIKLLCGLYEPESGVITLNGKDIKTFDYSAYLNLFSVVFQDFKLFALPIGENVAASRDYEDEKVWQALEVAGIGDKVRDLPLGLHRYLFKDVELAGTELSGGEEQKLAIARAWYKDAPFMIFDEPTAALDPIAESDIYSKFNELIGDKAAVFVSHRLSSCRFCDRIAVFHQGQLVQLGTHEELLEDGHGKYYELWHAQAQYYR